MLYTGYDAIRYEEKRMMPELVMEGKLTADERNKLPDSAFGLPKERKYPLIVGNDDWSHLRDAISYFHCCKDEAKKKELAKNIAKVIKQYHVDVKISENNKIREYAKFD